MAQLPRLAQIQAKFASKSAARCACLPIFEGKAAAFIAEGLAYDDISGRLLVSGVWPRRIVVIHQGREQGFAQLPDGLSPFGMRVDARRKLIWVAAASVAQNEGARAGEGGRSALLGYDLRNGALRMRYDTPPPTGGRALNDVTLGPDGSVYASDANEGSIFRLAAGASALHPVCAFGILKSPQGMVVNASGRRLLVADYAAGLITLDLTSCEIRQVAVPNGVTTLTMDGLAQLADGSFAATQNGIHPARLVHFRLSPDWGRIVSFAVAAQGPRFRDPTLLAIHGTKVLAITGSQWASFDDGSEPVRPLSAWRVLAVSLPHLSAVRTDH
jgi:sugar lactone lactonase YvrE